MGNVLDERVARRPRDGLPLRSAGDLMFWLAKDCTEAGVVCRNTPMLFTDALVHAREHGRGVGPAEVGLARRPVACTVFCEP